MNDGGEVSATATSPTEHPDATGAPGRPPAPPPEEVGQELLALLRKLGPKIIRALVHAKNETIAAQSPQALASSSSQDGEPPRAALEEPGATLRRPPPWPATATPPPASSSYPAPVIFNYTPQDLKEHLDEYVIGQDEAKKTLAIGICEHYGRLKAMQHDPALANEHYQKQNILLLGPSGVGKTYLVKTLAKLIGVPFVKADANRFTETGFVGANAEDLIRDLVQIANGDIARAQYGIVYLDEADKIAGHQDASDIAHRGVQNALLKLMEDSEIDLLAGHDMASQLQSFMEFQKEGKISRKIISTKYILFIVSGAFEGLEDIIKRRCHLSTINLNSSNAPANAAAANIYQQVTAQDLIKYGLGPEFVGRLPIRVACQNLTIDDYENILRCSRGSILHQYHASFAAYDIEIHFTREALHTMAVLAAQEKTGARALVTIADRVLREFKFYLPSLPINYLVVTSSLIEHPLLAQNFMHQNPRAFDRANFQEILGRTTANFNQQHQTHFRFAPAAVAFLYQYRRPRPPLALLAKKILLTLQGTSPASSAAITPAWLKANWDRWHSINQERQALA